MAMTLPVGTEDFPARPEKLLAVTVDKALDEKIKEALAAWVVRMSYKVTRDDEDVVSDDIAYKDIREEHILLKDGEPVGIWIEEIVYYHNSNVTDTHLHALYFKDAPDYDIMIEGARSGSYYLEGYVYLSLRRRDAVPSHSRLETANTEFFPVPKIYC